MPKLIIDGQPLDLAKLQACQTAVTKIEISDGCRQAIENGSRTLKGILDSDKTVYGINTGFGLLASERISSQDLDQLQRNLVLSHAAGTGPAIEDRVVRLIMVLKILSLSQGYSGVRTSLISMLCKLVEADALPVIPVKGSVGASGDLAPLAHMSCALIGIGQVKLGGQVMPAADALEKIGLEPFQLGPKEGLALLNGTQVSTALALDGLFCTQQLFRAATVVGAMSVDAAMGSDVPFDPRIHRVRLHEGQNDVAKVYRQLLAGSQIRQSHLDCQHVQDPYSLRCQPQVMGACLDQIRFVARTLECEANSVTDNPLIFPDSGEVLSGGNFHAEPVALAADSLALAIAEIGSLSERRISLLIDKHLSGLPPFLVKASGLNSGFMVAQVTAAAVASENKSLAHPASVDSLPTSANQEDHVSMATFAARRLADMNDNTATIIAIEWLAAAQGIDFRAPLKTSPALQRVHETLRATIPMYDQDRYFADDIQQAKQLVMNSTIFEMVSEFC